MKRYSRFAKLEERRAKRSAFLYFGLTVTLLVFLLIFGVPTLSKFAGVLTDNLNGSGGFSVTDKTPPAPPRITDLPEYTNEDQLEIKGSVESNVNVLVFLNNKKDEVFSDTSGNFSLRLRLSKGENTLWVYAVDKAGNESAHTKEYKIVLDNEAPTLLINKPEDAQQFWGENERQLAVEGKTESECTVTINGKFVILDSEGKFRTTVGLNEGANSLEVKATDRAGNSTENKLTVSFSL